MNIVTVFRLASAVVDKLPEKAGRAIFDMLGTALGLSGIAGVRQLRANQSRILDRPDGRVRARRRSAQAMRSYMRYYYEAFRLPSLTPEQIRARVRVEGREKIDAELASGSVTGALMHAGNWDLAGAWATRDLAPVHTIAEKLEPPELFEGFLRFRQGLGLTIYPLVKGARALRELEKDMDEALCFTPLLADRDLTASGVEVTLCGHKALVAPGPALLAQRTGRPIMPIFSSYERISGERAKAAGTTWGMLLTACEPVCPEVGAEASEAERQADLARMSQEWVSALEPHLRSHLADWHMLQKVFVADLDPERLARARARAATHGQIGDGRNAPVAESSH